MESLTDIELAGRATGGDTEAFAFLVDRHYMLAYRVAYKWCGVKENAEDITQEVFIKLGRSIHGFNGDSKFTTWLYRITVNTTKDFLRNNSRKAANEANYIKEAAFLSSGTEGSDNPVSSEELYSALEDISPKLKDALILVYGEGLTHKEAASVLGCAETTISWRVFKGRGKLKKLLSREV